MHGGYSEGKNQMIAVIRQRVAALFYSTYFPLLYERIRIFYKIGCRSVSVKIQVRFFCCRYYGKYINKCRNRAPPFICCDVGQMKGGKMKKIKKISKTCEISAFFPWGKEWKGNIGFCSLLIGTEGGES